MISCTFRHGLTHGSKKHCNKQLFDFPNVNLYEVAANITTNDDPKSDDAKYYFQLAFRNNKKIPSQTDPNVLVNSTE